MNQEELKQRMIELLKPFVSGCACEYESGSCELTDCRSCNAQNLADHFIENGVTIREWIPVTERLPIKGTNVLIYSKSGGRAEGELSEDGWWQYRWCCRINDVTHWMPLPLPPETEKGDEGK